MFITVLSSPLLIFSLWAFFKSADTFTSHEKLMISAMQQILGIPLIYYFYKLMNIMKKKHNYEYHKNFKAMTVYFGVNIIAILFDFALDVL